MSIPTAIDAVSSRNSTRINIIVNGQRVGRVQSFQEDVTNNVQVIGELGRAFMAELKKGITAYTFSIARFLTRQDVFEPLKKGAPFSLELRDDNYIDDGGTGTPQSLEYFQSCMINSISTSYGAGAAMVGLNASVVTIGEGLGAPR